MLIYLGGPFIYLTLNTKNLRFAFEYVVHKKRQI